MEAAHLAREQGVTHASGTPSYFRLLLSLAGPADLTAINVGGRKAFPTEIEAALLEVAGVRAVRVSPYPPGPVSSADSAA